MAWSAAYGLQGFYLQLDSLLSLSVAEEPLFKVNPPLFVDDRSDGNLLERALLSAKHNVAIEVDC